jgi:hypothetical protein
MRLAISPRRAAHSGVVFAIACIFSSWPAAAAEWKQFVSTFGFSVAYPDDWKKTEESNSAYLALKKNNDNPAHGIGITPDGANLSVGSDTEHKTVESILTLPVYQPDPTRRILSRKQLPTGNGGCRQLVRVDISTLVVEPEDIPKGMKMPPPILEAVFICVAEGRTISVDLEYWSNGGRMKEYEDAALKMAQSLRVLH